MPCDWKSATGVHITQLQSSHVGSLQTLYERCAGDVYPPFRHPRILADPFAFAWFDPDAAAVATDEDGRVVGAALAQLGQAAADCFLMGLFVDPDRRRQGTGDALLGRIIDYSRKNHRIRLRVSPEARQYFALGVDEGSPGHVFLTRRGFREDAAFGYRPVWMAIDATGWRMPQRVAEVLLELNREGMCARISLPEDQDAILAFTEKSFAGWYRDLILPAFRGNGAVPISIAVRGSRVVGFTGPLYVDVHGAGTLGAVGVDEEFRGRGIARVVFNGACRWWREHGARTGHLWTGTGNRAIKVYEEAGLRAVAAYVVLARKVT